MMNATSLYVSTCKLVIQANPDDPGCLTDLCRLMPYLRQSLSCTVCGNLLIEPQTPTETNCQHHVCKSCKGGKKKLKPTCSWCKNYNKYYDNLQLRILLQCYKKLCEYVMNSPLYRLMSACPSEGNITDLVDEGAGFKDEYKCNAGLSKSAYSILPCIYTHTSTQTNTNSLSNSSLNESIDNSVLKHNGSSMYSVMYPGSGNKMVIKRKVEEEGAGRIVYKRPAMRRPFHRRAGKMKQGRQGRDDDRRGGKGGEKKQRFGCRCGNATVTPGKLTCCGQRCPCYVVSKACLDCKCRGCRNPHTKEGQKIIRDVLDLKSEPTDDGLDADMLHVDKMPSEEESDVIPKLLSLPFKMNAADVRQHIIQRGRPAPLLCAAAMSAPKSTDRTFKSSWYELHRWLCGSYQLNRLFCWPCLLMRPESSSWCSTGVDDFKRFSSLASKHAACKSHLKAIAEYDGVLIEVGLVPEFSNEENTRTYKEERASDSDSDYLGNYLGPKRPSAPSKNDAQSQNSAEASTLTFRTWQQTTRALLDVKDPKLAKRKRRLAKIKIKNAELEGEKIRLEIQLLEAKLEFQRTLSGSASTDSHREETAHFSIPRMIRESEKEGGGCHQQKITESGQS